MRRLAIASCLACALVVSVAACEEHFPRAFESAPAEAVIVDAAIADASSPVDADIPDVIEEPEASVPVEAGTCDSVSEAETVLASPHVPEGSTVDYPTNPPSSGPHYPVWANFQIFNHPVDDPYLVHDLEHGAVLLLYKCGDDAGDCADTAAKLKAIRDAVPDDPECDPGVRVRIVIAPRPANDAPITAAAWGFTYHADCVDPVSLAAFITAHYGQGPEDLCYPGSVF